jgi:1-acyl-sn-glycerol-3-phosphate acyltransferase
MEAHDGRQWNVSQADVEAEPGPTPASEPELSAGLHGSATSRPGVTYRFLRGLWWFLARCLRIHMAIEGRENLPRDAAGRPTGRWIAAGMPHRTWIDPFVPWILLPSTPRLAFFGDARTMARSPLRRWVVARLGSVIPIPAGRDPKVVAKHLDAAREVLDAGAVFLLMPETGLVSELGSIRRLGSGMGYMALRNRAPIVPLIFGGNHELYFGRRILMRVLPAMDPLELAGLASDAPLPARGSNEEREAVHVLMKALAERVAPAIADVHERAEATAPARKQGLFLTKLFR